MRIPKSFQLHAQKINIVQDNQLEHVTGNMGEARYRVNEIALQPNNKGVEYPSSQLEQVFYHELVHWILHHMEEKDLRSNEKFVEGFSQLLHQALITAKY